ncbi:MAG TPA: protein kinase [Thermomicrobiales bacterium]|nr:protein kinase [Thermomicrobiales bacterium]
MNVDAAPRPPAGPYRILDLIGQGGGGEVYRAWDPRLEREVALKILHRRLAIDAGRLDRFVAEARAAGTLNHPNIVTVFDVSVEGDQPFIASELIDGKPLRDEIRRGHLPLKRALDLATQIADGLSAAHDAGIVHRDLKPENIMVTRNGRAKILDFGLTRIGIGAPAGPAPNGAVTETEAGLRSGTVPYMSPEQALGSTSDFHGDQFSFGLILYEMLTGRSAFRRDTPAATLHAIINDELPDMSALGARTPVQLRWIVERCLAKQPADRYASTADLHRELRMLRERLTEIADRGASRSWPFTMWWRVALTAVASAAVVGTLIGLLVPLVGGEVVDVSAVRFTPLATEAAYEGFASWSPTDEIIVYTADVGGVLQLFTRRLSSSQTAQVTFGNFDATSPFWSHDGKRIYYISQAENSQGIWSVGAAGGTPEIVVRDALRGAISPDGTTIAFLRDEGQGDIVGDSRLWMSTPGTIEPWSSDSVESHAVKSDALGNLPFVEGSLAFSPDGSRLGICAVARSIELQPEARGWQFWIVPLKRGAPYRRLEGWADLAPRATNFSWLPDGHHVILSVISLARPGADLWIADLNRDRWWPLTRSADNEYYPSASPSGDQIVFTREDSDYDLVSVALEPQATESRAAAIAPLRPLIVTARSESEPAWSADGSLLAYVTDRSGQDEIWLHSRQGERWVDRPVVTQKEFGDDLTIMLGAPTFSPDGHRIAFLRNAQKPMIWPLRIWTRFTDGGAPVPLLPASHEGYQSAPTWSPDGQWIAYTEWKSRQWVLAKIRVGSGAEPIVLRSDGVPGAAPHWSPLGDWITWETERGLILVSPDGTTERTLQGDHATDRWLFHEWAARGTRLAGIKESENLQLVIVEVDPATGREKVLAHLGPSPPVNNPVKGFSLSADGRTAVIATVHLRGDLWVMDGVKLRRRTLADWFAPALNFQ